MAKHPSMLPGQLALDRPESRRASASARWVGLVFALVLLATVAVVSYRRVRDFETDVFWRGHAHQAIARIEKTKSALLGADSMRRAYRLGRNPADRDRMEELIATSERELAILQTTTQDIPNQEVLVASLRTRMAERLAVLRDGLELPSWEDLAPAQREEQRARQGRGSDLAKQMNADFDAMLEGEQRLLSERERRTVASAEATERTILYGSAVGILLVVIIYGSHLRETLARARVQRELAYMSNLFEAVLRETTDVVAIKDANLRYLLVNEACRKNFNRPESEILGKTDGELLTGGTADTVIAADRAVIQSGKANHFEFVATVDDRSWTFHSTKSPLRGPDGAVLGVVSISRDVTDEKRLQRQLQESLRAQALRDPLTGLFNRRYLDETLPRELRRMERRSLPLALMMVDVDHFKQLNDTAGHPAGDQILRRVADVLVRGVRSEDVVCRYGGEEFVIVLPELSASAAAERADLLRREVEELETEIAHHGILRVTASFGLACSLEQGWSGSALLAAADSALYAAKRAGRNRVVVAGTGPALSGPPSPASSRGSDFG